MTACANTNNDIYLQKYKIEFHQDFSRWCIMDSYLFNDVNVGKIKRDENINVGVTKALGYLPLKTGWNALRITISREIGENPLLNFIYQRFCDFFGTFES